MKHIIRLTENRVLQALTEYLQECDSDELARIAGDIFGGECFSKPIIDKKNMWTGYSYEFEPNENYAGEFGELDDE
jgi:hypothetical protein